MLPSANLSWSSHRNENRKLDTIVKYEFTLWDMKSQILRYTVNEYSWEIVAITGNNVWSQIWSHIARYKWAIMINSYNYKKYEVPIMRMNHNSQIWSPNCEK